MRLERMRIIFKFKKSTSFGSNTIFKMFYEFTVHIMAEMELQKSECPACQKYYTEPKILPCSHLLCRDCLVKLMKRSPNAACPVCSSAIVHILDFHTTDWDDYVDSLPTHFAMAAITQSIAMLSDKHLCYNHSEVRALSLCLNCSLKMCGRCAEVHISLPLSRLHRVKELGKLTPEKLAASLQAPCAIHPGKTCDIFCITHGVPICRACATLQHRGCSTALGNYKQTFSQIFDCACPSSKTLWRNLTDFPTELSKFCCQQKLLVCVLTCVAVILILLYTTSGR